MASSSSGPLSKNAVYQLGQYQFKLNVTKSQEGDSTQIQAQMTKDGQSKYHSIYEEGDATVESWRVEANESTADVYASTSVVKGIPIPGKKTPVPSAETADVQYESGRALHFEFFEGSGKITGDKSTIGNVSYYLLAASSSQGAVAGHPGWHYPLTRTYEYNGKTVYWASMQPHSGGQYKITAVTPAYDDRLDEAAAWMMIYGSGDKIKEENLVARFAIETQQAVDPTQPEQWDQQPDTGDPQYRLDLTVWGALSGRHNDPLRDPSYSYVPADQDSVKGYGSGGDGGHGGGGGGGASTVIVYDFGTDKAGSKEINAYARRHGYGSSGGRGGRGGDGCIIVYY